MCHFNDLLLSQQQQSKSIHLPTINDFSNLKEQKIDSDFQKLIPKSSEIQNGIELQKNKHIRITKHTKYSNIYHIQANV